MAYLTEHSFHPNSVNRIEECTTLLKSATLKELEALAVGDVKSAIALSYAYAVCGNYKDAGIYARNALVLDGMESDSIDEVSALEELAFHSPYGNIDQTFNKAAKGLMQITRDAYLKSIRHD